MLEQGVSARPEQAPRPPSRRLPFFLLGAVAGFLVGGALASAVWLLFLVGEMYADRPAPSVKPPATVAAGKVKDTSEDAQKAGDEFVRDLNQNRLLGAYRMTTDEYQTRRPRLDFERMVVQNTPEIFQWPCSGGKETKVRPKSGAGTQYEYYSTATHVNVNANMSKRINVSLVLVQQNGVWKVNDVEIQSDQP